MVSIYNHWVLKGIKKIDFPVRVLDADASGQYIKMILDKYIKPECHSYRAIWQEFKEEEAEYLKDTDGLSHMGDYTKDIGEVYYFVDDEMVFVVKGEHAGELLEESGFSDAYISDREGSFLLCHNEYEYLIGMGDAASWVKALEEKL